MKVKEFNLCLSKIRSGDKTKIKPIYDTYSGLMLLAAFDVVKDCNAANDIMSDFIKNILDGAADTEYISNPVVWIVATVRNYAAKYTRPQTSIISDTHLTLLSKSTMQLTDTEREVFYMYYLCNYKLKEISEVLGRVLIDIKQEVESINKKLQHIEKHV